MLLDGYGGNQCKQNEASKSEFLKLDVVTCHKQNSDAECGGTLKANKTWTYIESPGYADGAYSEDQKCSWIIQVPHGKRIEIKFVDFGFLCTTSCVDYVELKLAKNQRLTGPRFKKKFPFKTCMSFQILLPQKTRQTSNLRIQLDGYNFSLSILRRAWLPFKVS